MIRLEYISSNGTTFDLLSWDGLKTETADYHNYKWGTNVAKKQYGEKINYFTKNAQTFKTTLLFRGPYATRRQKIDAFHFCTEYDIAHKTPGRIFWGDDYIECYITSSDTKPRDDGATYTENDIQIYAAYPFWIEEQTLSIMPSGGTSVRPTDKGYPQPRLGYPYLYSYPYAPNASYMYVDHYMPCNFKMVVWGPAESVSITIADHIYAVNHALRANQYMVIDSRPGIDPDRRCYIVSASGEITNVFDYRSPEHLLFQPIPSGDVIINYSRDYGVDLTVFKERSEPRCLS